MPTIDKRQQQKKRKFDSKEKENHVDIKQHAKRKKINSDEKGKEYDIKRKAAPLAKKQGSVPNERRKEKDTKPKVNPAVKKQELITNIKLDWNSLRIKSIPEKDRPAMIEKLMKKITGHVAEVTLRHDASRIVQSIFQFGTTKQRIIILDELLKILAETCKTPYGHFAVLKAMSYCTQITEQKKICNSLTNKFVSLAIHSIGARTIETLMQLYPSKLTTPLKAEFYGKKFTVLLEAPPKDLQALLQLCPTKRSAILDHMRDLIHRFIQKGLFEFKFVHQLLWEYTQEVAIDEPHKVNELIKELSDFTPKLLTTKNGAKTCCTIITYALAKDRKRIIKALKGKVLESLLHESAHLGIMRLIDVTDDTVQIQKLLLVELLPQTTANQYTATGELIPFTPPLLSIATNRYGSKLLLRLLSPKTRHLEPNEEFLFHEDVSTSKKSFAARRLEHLAFFKKSLLSLCSKFTEKLFRDRYGSKVLEEVIKVFLPSTVITAMVNVVTEQGTPVDEVEEGDEVDVFPDTNEEEEEGEDDDYEDEYYENAGEEGGEEDEEDEMQVDGSASANDELGDIDDDEEENSNNNIIVNNAEEEEEDTENNNKGLSTSTKSSAGDPQSNSVSLPIYEDPIAHQALKKLLKFEKTVEDSINSTTIKGKDSNDVEVINDELWDTKIDSKSTGKDSIKFAKSLLVNLLNNQDLLRTWLATNRACFVLTEVCRMPSVNSSADEMIFPLRSIVTSASANSDVTLVGSKCLQEFLNNL